MAELRLVFKKNDEASFISHLDLMRLFTRAIKRAGIKVKYTSGFNPHAYLVFSAPLSLGYESDRELLEFDTEGGETCDDVMLKLSENLPRGIEVVFCSERKRKLKEMKFARWQIICEIWGGISNGEIHAISELLSSPEVNITKETKRGQSSINLTEKIKELSVRRLSDIGIVIEAVIPSSSDDFLNPSYIVRGIQEKLPIVFDDTFFKKLEIYDEKMDIFK